MQDWPRDLRALVISVVYVGAVVGASELIRRLTGRSGEFTRKFVHVGIGIWIIPTLFLFTKWYWAALPSAAAVVMNFASMRLKLIRSIERGDSADYGTVLFPLSFAICIAAFFATGYPEAAAAGIMVMALGDSAATIVGRAFGRHPYTFLGAKKSIEGSAAMLAVSWAAVFATLVLFGTGPAQAAAVAALLAAVGTALEAAGKNGLDNLTVPLVCSTLAYLALS